MAKSDLSEKIMDSRVAKHYKAAGTLNRKNLNEYLDQLEDSADRSAPITATIDREENENDDVSEQTEEVPASTADEPAQDTDSAAEESSLVAEDSTTDNV